MNHRCQKLTADIMKDMGLDPGKWYSLGFDFVGLPRDGGGYDTTVDNIVLKEAIMPDDHKY